MIIELGNSAINSDAGRLFNHYWYNSDPSGSITGAPFFGKCGWGECGIGYLLDQLTYIGWKMGFKVEIIDD